MKLSIIIVTYNVSDYLRQCIRSIQSSFLSSEKIEIIVVDNYSNDNTDLMIQNNFKNDVIYIKNHENLGFSKAVNIGLKLSKGHYKCLINPDTILDKNCLINMIRYSEKSNKPIILGAKVVDHNGCYQLSSRRAFPSMKNALIKFFGLDRVFKKNKFFGAYNYTYLSPEKKSIVDSVSGSCMMFSSEVYQKIGEFDERFFLYFEDTDYCLRAKENGINVIYYPNSTLIHYKGESMKRTSINTIKVFYESYSKFLDKYEMKNLFLIRYAIQFVMRINFIKDYLSRRLPQITAFSNDVISIIFSYIISVSIWFPFKYNTYISFSTYQDYSLLLIAYISSWILVSKFVGIYRVHMLSYFNVLTVSVLSLLVCSSLVYYIQTIAYSRAIIFIIFFQHLIYSAIWRYLIYLKTAIFRSENVEDILFSSKVVIVGKEPHILKIYNSLQSSNNMFLDVVGYISDCSLNNNQLSYMGNLESLNQVVIDNQIKEVVVSENMINSCYTINILKDLPSGVSFKVASLESDILLDKGKIDKINEVPLIDFNLSYYKTSNMITKRLFDILLSALILFLTTPIHIYFFLFKKYRFRNNNIEKIINYYPSGISFIKYLPFLFLIIMGRYSFVGNSINGQDNISKYKKGIFSLSSIFNDWEKENHYNIYYIKNYSILLDMKIIYRSIFKIV